MTDRLFQITYVLMSEGTVTCSALAERFECSTRTILRDIEKLSLAGVPVYMNRGKGGGIGIMDDYVIDREMFSDKEKKQILSSMHALMETGYGDEKETLEKLKGIFGRDESDWIEIEFSRWGTPGKIEEYFTQIKRAIAETTAVVIKYAAAGKDASEREVHPLKLCYRCNSWYVYAFCTLRNDYRFFKLSRIMDLRFTSRKFKGEKTGRVLVQTYSALEKSIKIKLHVKKQALYRAVEELPVTEKLDDGSIISVFECDDFNAAVSYILSYGPDVEVVEPEDVRKELIDRLRSMYEVYSLYF